MSVFFSYARADGDFVLRLARDLRTHGVTLWLDQLDIPPGVHWDSEIERALRQCQTQLVVLSPNAVASTNVMDEVSFALDEKKRVLPVMLAPCEVPFRLRRLQHIDFTPGYDEGLQRLLASLGQVSAPKAAVPGPAPTPVAPTPVAPSPPAPTPPAPTPPAPTWTRTVALAVLGVAVVGSGAAYVLRPPTDLKTSEEPSLSPPAGVVTGTGDSTAGRQHGDSAPKNGKRSPVDKGAAEVPKKESPAPAPPPADTSTAPSPSPNNPPASTTPSTTPSTPSPCPNTGTGSRIDPRQRMLTDPATRITVAPKTTASLDPRRLAMAPAKGTVADSPSQPAPSKPISAGIRRSDGSILKVPNASIANALQAIDCDKR